MDEPLPRRHMKRLGLMLAEIAGRTSITAGTSAELEDRVIGRQATPEELAALTDE